MANQIRMSPETMRTRAKETDNQVNNMQDLIRSMDRLLNTLKGEWEGDAMQGYEDRFNKIKPVLKNAQELLEEIAGNLRSTAKIVEETDQKIASQYRS